MEGTRDPGTLAHLARASGHDAPHTPAEQVQAILARVLARPVTVERRMADAIRALAIDATEAAGSGHPGLALAMADTASTLWTRVLRFDAADPRWPDRDRFVLSAGQGAMLLYALLHLTGHAGMGCEALASFRQLHSPAAGQPEHGQHPAIEATAGPLGEGLGSAVGMALAERMMAARFGKSLVDHRTWAVVSDGDLMEGISQEAAALAGQLRLEKLTVLWDDGGAAREGTLDDQLKRFAALGWATKQVDGHEPSQVLAALSLAQRSKKPTLIACRTILGAGAPVRAGAEARSAKQALDWPHPAFTIPVDLAARWAASGTRGTAARRAWLKRLAKHPLRAEFERVVAGRLPETWHEAMAALKLGLAEARPFLSTREAGERTLAALLPAIPELVGGSAGAPPPGGPSSPAMAVGPGSYGGRHVPFGDRQHGMAACLNGLALHGGLVPYAVACLVSSDLMRPSIRLAALMRQRVIHVLTHDSIGLGQDGPAQQPVEQLAGFRAMPGLHVMRPADAVETAECWELAIRRAEGPTLLVLSEQAVPALRTEGAENRCARGGYVLAEADGARRATLIATGSEVGLAVEARRLLAEEGLPVAVVSLPCWALFAQQEESVRAGVLGTAPRVGIEAACGFGWERWLGDTGIFIGMTGFGASAPAETLFRHFGITPEAITLAVKKRLLQSNGS